MLMFFEIDLLQSKTMCSPRVSFDDAVSAVTPERDED